MKAGCREFNAELKYSNDIRENITYWTTDINVRNYLNQYVPCGDKSTIVEVPLFMYSAPLESIKAYIETCFNCDGDLNVSNSSRINYNTCSENFAQGLSLLLKKFGILCTIQHTKGKYKKKYRLTVSGIFFNKFMDTFKLIDRKMTTHRNKANTKLNRFVGDYYLSDVHYSSPCGYKDIVYDFTVSETHSFIANGVYTHNCHHCGLNMFNIIDKFNAQYKIGLTATPKRSDGLDYVFDLFFGGLCYKNVLSKNDKDINRVKVIIKSSKAKYRPFLFENMVYNYYDYDPKSLSDNIEFVEDIPYKERPRIPHFNIDNSVVLNRHYKIQVCKDILNEYRKGHSCLVLFTQKDHIDNYYRYLSRYIPPHQIMTYYGDNKEKFSVLRKKAESREVLVTLATYAKSTEGTNVKAWEVEFLVSSINNEKNTEQAVGRIRRSKEGKINPVLVYDYRCEECYSLKNHINTRLSVYRELDFEVYDLQAPKPPQRSVFSRGYHRK